MTRVLTALAAVLGIATGAMAGDDGWTPMTGAEITEALSERTLIYATARQTFYASGDTLYIGGQRELGKWRVLAGQYCSQWPPGDHWGCFDMDRHADGRLRFVSDRGGITEGWYGQ